ncbi:hypothetical protein Lfu02_37680 [Longispora fulva]|uniref:Uncharacterized protein n=1 Tax=Longispora fulva TaxID=619741 RepID=A0A8J7KNB8_9ACTN|nr:hypothetical protein [Longispora fulva]MBG6141454.1 hypothetical protein [Longispora fulva]GIG59396.1 hypothetical protein Lfu02_37680 [Longispora fulva]
MTFHVVRTRRARDCAEREQVLEVSSHADLQAAMHVFHMWRRAHEGAIAVGDQQVMVVTRERGVS